MTDAKKFAPDITVNPNYLLTLKSMEHEAYRWQLAANGKRPAYNNPIGRMLATDLARQALARYFDAIEKLIPTKKEGEIA
jgi:hypothetical protein